ncbi:hypothetical protein FRC07_010207 [Ceratobasidium sp. 392]|nr:hypothetical protein FRC07_010207 [Ceratobasidium sp. 392]
MNLQDGFLLATHLLSPLLVANKTPWIPRSSSKRLTSRAGKVPIEILQQIAFYLDHDSYQKLPRVSRLFRGIHARYPRVGGFILQDYIDDGNYRVLNTATDIACVRHLQRETPFDQYYMGLVNSFQRVSFGPPNIYPSYDARTCIIRGVESQEKGTLVDGVERIGKGVWTPIYAQVVHGTWTFVAPEDATSNFPEEMEFDSERDRYPGYGTWKEVVWL